MPQQTNIFEACSWVPILQVGGLGKVRVNCFPKAIATWHARESNPRPPDLESDALTSRHAAPDYANYAKILKKAREQRKSKSYNTRKVILFSRRYR
ncbi:hypothetical protein ElyMa_001986300 [Elysia marginata]|uniref:Uncharacterized protein n=1 Tax=Elysia marginata TaxID=1093978 RepID=A0AAV4F3J7_9GAST|nr:hypothetical protein ElyMa_001986300 [Elysia marginata]